MKKMLLASSVISVEHPKDFCGCIRKDYYVIVTHDLTFMLSPQKEKKYSCWLNKKEMEKAIKNARPWTILDSLKLKVKRFVLSISLSEKDDYQFCI